MSKNIKIALAGEGGQGVQSIAEILAEAANKQGKKTIYIPNFGVEQRGGVSIAFVQISDEIIGFPRFKTAEILIALSLRAVERTKRYISNATMYIYDSSLITDKQIEVEKLPKAKNIYAIPANEMAKTKLHPRVFNIIILGGLIAVMNIFSLETIQLALEIKWEYKFVTNSKLREMNLNALEIGYNYIKDKV